MGAKVQGHGGLCGAPLLRRLVGRRQLAIWARGFQPGQRSLSDGRASDCRLCRGDACTAKEVAGAPRDGGGDLRPVTCMPSRAIVAASSVHLSIGPQELLPAVRHSAASLTGLHGECALLRTGKSGSHTIRRTLEVTHEAFGGSCVRGAQAVPTARTSQCGRASRTQTCSRARSPRL